MISLTGTCTCGKTLHDEQCDCTDVDSDVEQMWCPWCRIHHDANDCCPGCEAKAERIADERGGWF